MCPAINVWISCRYVRTHNIGVDACCSRARYGPFLQYMYSKESAEIEHENS